MLTVTEMKKTGRKPRAHPNGFIQFDLDGDCSGPWSLGRRLHIWPETPLVTTSTYHPIHDHAFCFTSQVLLGCLTNVLYEFDLSTSGDYVLYTAGYEKSSDPAKHTNVPLVRLKDLGFVRETSRHEVCEGSKYSMSNKILHSSLADGLTMTVIDKTSTDMSYCPSIAIPVHVVPDTSFRRDSIPVDKLWDIIEKTMQVYFAGELM